MWRYLLVSIILFGCSDRPYEKPSIVELSGMYKINEASVTMRNNKKGYSMEGRTPSIQLLASKVVKIKDLPDCYLDGFGQGHGRLLSGIGTWEVIANDAGYGITLDITPGNDLPPAIYHGSSIIISGPKPPYILKFVIGDPDEDEFISYVRTNR